MQSPLEIYCIEHSTRPSELARELQLYTQKNVHGSNMLIGEMEGSLITFLLRLGRVRSVLELGTYTGYSSLVMAEKLPEDGKVMTIDINPETTKIAREFWARSPHGKKIELRLKKGLDALAEITETFDFIFIDADKGNYSNYLKWSVEHLNEGGMIIVDNTLWSGKVLEVSGDKQTEAIKAHNELARSLEGFTKTLLPLRDGMYLLQKG